MRRGSTALSDRLESARIQDLDRLAQLISEGSWHLRYAWPALPAGVLLAFLFMAFPDLPVLFIASTLVLYMVYPLLFLIPPEVASVRRGLTLVPAVARPEKILSAGRNAPMLAHILWNVFFINSRALAPPFGILFTADLIFLLAGRPGDGWMSRDYFLICLQCTAIVVYYAGIWVTRPYSHEFERTVRSLTSYRAKGGLYLWFLLLLVGAIATSLALLTTIAIFMPGMTFGTVVSGSRFHGIGTTIEFLAALAALFVFVRVFHGYTSLLVARAHLAGRAASLAETRDVLDTDADAPSREEAEKEGVRALLEARVYRTVRRTVAGYLPVYLIQPDITALLDESVLEGMEGHTRIAG
jgi:hypothetical protein